MKEYVVKRFRDRVTYLKFVQYMLEKSDAFSLVYFQYQRDEKIKKSTQVIKKALHPYLIKSWNGTKWASMETLNERGHIYCIHMYRAESKAIEGLSQASCIFDWDYPTRPMDLCFFKDGFSWFASCAHERYAVLYLNEKETDEELRHLGVDLEFYGEASKDNLFYDENSIIKKSENDY